MALAKQTVVMFRRIDTAMAYVRHFVMNKKGWTESILDKKCVKDVSKSPPMSASMQHLSLSDC